MKDAKKDMTDLFEHFLDHYCSSIFLAAATLTGLSDKKELGVLTMDILIDLWEKKDELFNEARPPAFIYKILLHHVFSYLKAQGNEDRISLLRNTLLIDPVYYAHILEP